MTATTARPAGSSRRPEPWQAPLGQADPAGYEEYGYDLVGNRTSSRKRDGSVLTCAYDNLDRVIRKTVPERAGLTAADPRRLLRYDAMGLQTEARFDALDGYGVIRPAAARAPHNERARG